jgi:arylsulfatase A-like enzyme
MLKVTALIVLLVSAYLANLFWSDKNDNLLNLPANKANLVLFTVDTLRADHLSMYGYNRKTTPNLDTIIKDSVIFDNAYTVSTYSAPAHASMLTGLYPMQFGDNNNSLNISEDIETLAEILKKQGYATAGFVGDSVLSETANFNQGFDTFSLDNIHADTALSITQSWAERSWKRSLNWLNQWLMKNQAIEKYQQQPFFLWFHANHPHGNYNPPPQYRNNFIQQAPLDIQLLETDHLFSLDSFLRQQIEQGVLKQQWIDWAVAQYDGEILFVDHLFGQLLSFLKKHNEYNNTHIIFVSDHGEVLFEYWRAGKIRSAMHHANLYYPSVLKIPLLIKPAMTKTLINDIVFIKGQRTKAFVSSVDIFNTVLDLLQITTSQSIESLSLVPLLKNSDISHREAVFFSGKSYENDCSGVINSQWQFVRCQETDRKKYNLFELKVKSAQDSAAKNIALENKTQLLKLEQQLDNWEKNLTSIHNNKSQQLSEQMRMHLKKAGYLDKRENL